MSKDSINIKSNGLRNELKEIRKAIDRLTNAIEARTHTHENTHISSRHDADDLMRFHKTAKSTKIRKL